MAAAAEAKAEAKVEAKKATLPELMGTITSRILSALENGDTSTKQSEINGCRQDMKMWYEAMPEEKRKAVAKDAKRIMQNYRNIGEQFYADMVNLTAQDI